MNNLDRTSKTLLFFLVVGIWGLLLRPFFLPAVVQAQTSAIPQRTKQTALVAAGEYLYLYQDGRLFVYGFDAAIKRRRELAAKGYMRPAEQDETKVSLLSTYDLALRPPRTK